jgi:phage terminase large subunit-like protein
MNKREFKQTDSQKQATELLGNPDVHHVLLYGGSRSGKTIEIIRSMIIRAVVYAGSRQLVLRRTSCDVRTSVGMDTMPKIIEMCFPGIPCTLDKTDWFFKFGNGSEIWLGGLDDKERAEKILGKEYITIYFNEASQIAYESIITARSRLAQLSYNQEGRQAINKEYYDCNPPTKSHWLYKVFVKHIEPIENMPLANPEDYAMLQMNPDGNKENIDKNYLESTLANMPYRQRQRFLAGEFTEDMDSGLWTREIINKHRVRSSQLPQFKRTVVAVDPAVTANEKSDETGIVVAALGFDDDFYILRDATIKCSPAMWAKEVCNVYYEYDADRIVAEVNNGGDLVEINIRTVDKSVAYKKVTATRGKIVRAEPIAALYEQGRVHHVEMFNELEDELCEYNPVTETKSPNRLDALVWALTELNAKKYRAMCF